MTEINDKKAEQMAALDIVQSAIDYFEHAFGPRKARTLKMIWGWVKKRSKPTG